MNKIIRINKGSLSRYGNTVVLAAFFLLISFVAKQPTLAQINSNPVLEDCGNLQNAYGPFDYTNPSHRRDKLPIVEQFHFTDEVFRLERGVGPGGTLIGDIGYTLRAFPNHHRALDAMARLHRASNVEKFPQSTYSLACFFDRGRRMAPDDPVVPMLQGIHYFKTGRFHEAESKLELAVNLDPNSPEIHYNLGLLYLRIKDYQNARMHALRAYELGYPLPGLRRKLIELNQWEKKTKIE